MGDRRVVFGLRLRPTVVEGELFEICDDADGEPGGPGVAAELHNRPRIGADASRRFPGLDKEFSLPVDAK